MSISRFNLIRDSLPLYSFYCKKPLSRFHVKVIKINPFYLARIHAHSFYFILFIHIGFMLVILRFSFVLHFRIRSHQPDSTHAEMTPDQQKQLIDIRKRKQELLLEIQVSIGDFNRWINYFLACHTFCYYEIIIILSTDFAQR